MDDDVLELTRKCAEALGITVVEDGPQSELPQNWLYKGNDGEWHAYDPANDKAQAFELLCWLAERGTVRVDFMRNLFKFLPPSGPVDRYRCTTPAELRLAIMRAVCKIHQTGEIMSHHSSDGPFDPKPASELMKKLLGEFPSGKLNPSDEGATAIQVGRESDRVIIQFPNPTKWFGGYGRGGILA